MSRWFRWLRVGRSMAGRATFDVLFAVSFLVFVIGVGTLFWGVFVSDASAIPGLGIVAAVAGGYASFVFGVQGARADNRSVVGSLGRGYKRTWHWIRPPRS